MIPFENCFLGVCLKAAQLSPPKLDIKDVTTRHLSLSLDPCHFDCVRRRRRLPNIYSVSFSSHDAAAAAVQGNGQRRGNDGYVVMQQQEKKPQKNLEMRLNFHFDTNSHGCRRLRPVN
jgi:hypothetical protein